MIDLQKLKKLRRQGPSALLGLALDGARLDGVVLKRTNGALQLQQAFSVTLSLDPLTADPELVGREIRNHLDAAGVRERHCAVCLPLKWALAMRAELPPLPESDVAGFLQIEAERDFPCDVATLRMATSRSQVAGKPQAMLIGIPAGHIALLEQALEKAKLRPASFSIGVAALQPPDAESSDGILALAIGENHLDLQITCGGGVVALRTIEAAPDHETGQPAFDAPAVAREIRITLGQFSDATRQTVRKVRIFGPREQAGHLAGELQNRFGRDFGIESVAAYSTRDFGVQLPTGAVVSPAFSLAARVLARRAAPFEFLPPKVTAWQQLAARYSSGRLRTAGAIGAAAILLIGIPFAWQQFQLMSLRSQWTGMSAKVKELDAIQQEIHQYRPWFDNSCRTLAILRQLTLAFPEDPAVSAKTIEIRDGNVVTCSGVARDNTALLRTLTALRAASGVADLKVDQIRGRQPVQFTFEFHWREGAGQ
jgi:hypothetical protein